MTTLEESDQFEAIRLLGELALRGNFNFPITMNITSIGWVLD